jgi:hypothetical protein
MSHFVRSIGGIFNVPSAIVCSGQYRRMNRLSASFGAGSQFNSLS